ncbi:MAG: nitroreductase family protein [Bacteroidales bacterium]|nr:nitroreductase family protein [Bacteroidales bacterium]MDD4684354.1 nitroreductase family protein [Bacteroidales bacterium]
MEFQELILKRQSDRKYLTRPVEQEKILKCIDAARLSPSACNAQPWTFVVVEEEELRLEVEKAASGIGMNKFAVQAPVIVAIVLEKPNFTSKIGSVIKDKEYPLIDIGIAANQFCLQAAEIGLGTCILGWFDEKKIKKLLNVPSSKRIPILITLGYSDARLREKTRKPIDKMYKQNKY